MTLNELSYKYYNLVSKKRFPNDNTIDILKHCSEEVVEATEAFFKRTFSKETFYDEVADIILCCLAMTGGLNIEKHIKNAIHRNVARIDPKELSDETDSFLKEVDGESIIINKINYNGGIKCQV